MGDGERQRRQQQHPRQERQPPEVPRARPDQTRANDDHLVGDQAITASSSLRSSIGRAPTLPSSDANRNGVLR